MISESVIDPRVSLIETEYKRWPAWRIVRGPLELLLVPVIGGRLMGIRWRGQELLFTQPEREGQIPPADLFRGDPGPAGAALGFPLWGGDKTWLAPQSRWIGGAPFVDLDSGPYQLEILSDGPSSVRVSMTSAVCRETGAQITRTIEVAADQPGWTLEHRIENKTVHDIQWELWDVCMVRRPALVTIPRADRSGYPHGVKTYPEEGSSVAARDRVVTFGTRVATIRCEEATEFKFGVDGNAGWIETEIPGLAGSRLLLRKDVPVYPDREYAHRCIAEVYNSGRYPYCEIELHGPLTRLHPREAFALTERQEIVELPD